MTRAMILAAGRGERLRPLTDTIPKPLIPVKNKPLIIHQLEKLASIGVEDVVINISYLADQIRNTLGDGKKFGLHIHYSYEPEALETAGGIIQALPLLGNKPFLVISSDIYTDYPFENLCHPVVARPCLALLERGETLAHLILVPNPPYHPKGDYSLDSEGFLTNTPQYNYGGIGLFHPDFFNDCPPGKVPLGPLMGKAIALRKITGDLYKGIWYNAGTLEELEKINKST